MLCRRSAGDSGADVLAHGNEHFAGMVAACSSVRVSTSMRVIGDAVDQLRRQLQPIPARPAGWSRRCPPPCRAEAPRTASTSMRRSARMMATSTGCAMNGSARLAARALVGAGGRSGRPSRAWPPPRRSGSRASCQVGEALDQGFSRPWASPSSALGGKRLLRHVRAASRRTHSRTTSGCAPSRFWSDRLFDLFISSLLCNGGGGRDWDATRASAGRRRCCA